ncbi:Ig-like domain-containing protein [Methanobrevibacter sp.]|uniref:Ig-like domain-containing protein n=1 Tax=Methanobrevibacter sp. TaxID=66852 RepID=UPI00386CBB8C
MGNDKLIITALIAIIAILLILIGATVIPTMMKEDCQLDITSPESLNGRDNITVHLYDSENNPISDKNIKVILRNSNTSQEYLIKTDSNGIATLTLTEDNVGTYNLTCSFEGDDTYKPASTTKEITVNGTSEATASSTQDPIEANRPKNDPNYKGYTPNHESEIINGWNPHEHETYRESMSDGNVKIHYDDGYFRLVDRNGYVITYGYGG